MCYRHHESQLTYFRATFWSSLCEPLLRDLTRDSKDRDHKPQVELSYVIKTSAFCIGENKVTDQLCGNRTADQCLCFLYIDNTIPLIPKSEISSRYLLCLYSLFCVGPGQKPEDRFSYDSFYKKLIKCNLKYRHVYEL